MKQSQNRIKKELEEVRKDPSSGVSVEVDEAAAFTHFYGIINGPDDTPYAVRQRLLGHCQLISQCLSSTSTLSLLQQQILRFFQFVYEIESIAC